MGFVRQMHTTDKPEIPDQAVRRLNGSFNTKQSEDDEIPESLIMNFDQTSLKYAPISNSTVAKKGSKHIPITGGAFKESITVVFGITYSGKFLPMQLIYKGKTQRGFPRVSFPSSFSLSANSKHFINTHKIH